MKEEKKKKTSTKKKIAWGVGLGSFAVLVGLFIWDKSKKVAETKNVGNILLNGKLVIELNPGRKEFVTTPGAIGFIDEQNKVEGVWIYSGAFKKGIDPSKLESVTGKPNFNIRYGQEMKYNVNYKLNPFKAFWEGVKQYSGYIPLKGKTDD